MLVFVANGTHQHMNFNYRLPEHPQSRTLEIRAGRQAKFPEDMNEAQFDDLVTQLQRYGGVEVSDVKSIIVPRSLVYSVDRKITSDKINEARERDQVARQEVSAEMLTNAGLAQFPHDEQMAAATKATSLEVIQLGEQDREGVKGGVDVEIAVRKNAGKSVTTKRKG